MYQKEKNKKQKGLIVILSEITTQAIHAYFLLKITKPMNNQVVNFNFA